MSGQTYIHFILENVKLEDEDLVSQICFDFSAAGVSEELNFHQMREDYQPEVISGATKTLNVFFEQMPSEEFSLRLSHQYPDVRIQSKKEEEKDWLEEWKKGYKPFCLSGDYWVVPTWLEKPDEAQKVIWIDPGMAFGTGTHATTQMAAELLIKETDEKSSTKVLDVGTGTGILAFLCEMQGASQVVATEIDEEARRVARENAELNQLQRVQVLEKQVESVTDKFDIVIANIIDGVLRKLRADLVRCMKPGGRLVLSGILIENEKDFLSEFLPDEEGRVSLEVVHRLEKDEWLGLVLREKS